MISSSSYKSKFEKLLVQQLLIMGSRKGFDSSFGGCPSPILPDGTMLKENPEVEKVIKEALDDVIKEELKHVTVFPLDISLYVKGTDTKVQPNEGTSVTITCPIPENLLANKENLKVVCMINGKLNVLETKVIQIDGVWCVQFTATHFSPYAMAVDTANALTVGVSNQKTDSKNNGMGMVILLFAISTVSTMVIVRKNRKLKIFL